MWSSVQVVDMPLIQKLGKEFPLKFKNINKQQKQHLETGSEDTIETHQYDQVPYTRYQLYELKLTI